MRTCIKLLLLALMGGLFPYSSGGVSAAERTMKGGELKNRWRYEFYAGRWWYWKPDAQWSYFDGRQWVDWGREPPRPIGRRQIAADRSVPAGRQTTGYRASGVYPFNYTQTNTPSSGLPAKNSAGNAGLGAASGFGSDTIAGGSVGVGLETGSRSGDASSGVGGGSVGGADVSGWNQRK